MAVTHYAWDPEFDCITEETTAAGALTARYTHEPRHYGGLVSQRRGSATSYYHYDNIGTTRVLTNQAQSATLQTTYTAFGENVNTTGSTVNSFGYMGKLGCRGFGAFEFLDVRQRNYSQKVARFISQDPEHLGQLDEAATSYEWCFNSPLYYSDPEGLRSGAFANSLCYPITNGQFQALNWRGRFQKVEVGPYNSSLARDNFFVVVGSTTKIHWAPNGNFANACGKCCCDRVGFIQIATGSWTGDTYWGFKSSYWDWRIDTVNWSGIAYSQADHAYRNICAPTAKFGWSIRMDDSPSFQVTQPLIGGVKMATHEFETCATCLSGVEGYQVVPEMMGTELVFPRVYTTYGCVKWSAHYVWSDKLRRYLYYRYASTRGAQDSEKSTAMRLDFQGDSPSETWKRVVREWTL